MEKHPYRSDIHLLGYVAKKDLPVLYSHAIALIYPSLYEGFGLPVLEGMACGTVVICTNNSSLPEVGGEAALYFDSINEKELVKHMHDIFQDQRNLKERKTLSIQQAAVFSWENFANSFIEAIKTLA